MKEIYGVIFDVDGVLVDTENIHFLAYKNLFNNLGYKLDFHGYKKWFSGKSIEGGFNSFSKDNHIKIDLSEFKQKKIYSTIKIFKEKMKFYEDTIKFIESIANKTTVLNKINFILKNPKLALTTGLEDIFIYEIFQKKPDFKKCFDVVVTPSDYTKSKPDPECYIATLDRMHLSPDEVIGIEDTPSGVEALNKAGIFSLAVTNTHNNDELINANYITRSLLDL